jgi:hypothetical protein
MTQPNVGNDANVAGGTPDGRPPVPPRPSRDVPPPPPPPPPPRQVSDVRPPPPPPPLRQVSDVRPPPPPPPLRQQTAPASLGVPPPPPPPLASKSLGLSAEGSGLSDVEDAAPAESSRKGKGKATPSSFREEDLRDAVDIWNMNHEDGSAGPSMPSQARQLSESDRDELGFWWLDGRLPPEAVSDLDVTTQDVTYQTGDAAAGPGRTGEAQLGRDDEKLRRDLAEQGFDPDEWLKSTEIDAVAGPGRSSGAQLEHDGDSLTAPRSTNDGNLTRGSDLRDDPRVRDRQKDLEEHWAKEWANEGPGKGRDF